MTKEFLNYCLVSRTFVRAFRFGKLMQLLVFLLLSSFTHSALAGITISADGPTHAATQL